MSKLEEVKSLIEPVLEKNKVSLYEITYEKEGSNNFLRIYIERENFDMDLDTCTSVSEEISALLDKNNIIGEEYFLDVGSSGKERELKNNDDYKKALGMYVRVKLKNNDEYEGIIENVLENSLKIKVNKKGLIKKIEIKFENIERTNLTYKI